MTRKLLVQQHSLFSPTLHGSSALPAIVSRLFSARGATFSSFLTSTRDSTFLPATESKSTFGPTKFNVLPVPLCAAICTVFSRRTGSRDFFIGFWAMRSVMRVLRVDKRGVREEDSAPAERRRDLT